MDYKKIFPQESLLHSINAYCFFKKDDDSVIYDYFFPNGRPAIVFHIKKPFSYFNLEGEWEKMFPVNFINCATCPVSLHSGEETDTIAVIVNPYSIYNMYNMVLSNTYQPIDARPNIEKEFYEQLVENKNTEARVMLLDAYFTEKLKCYNPQNDLFKRICDYIIQNQGIIERYAVAKEYGISENYIHKLFLQRIGISFKPFVQIIRISNILQELSCNNKHDWFEILDRYGYYDQAHFIKDFKKITGKTPQQYYHLDKTFSTIFSAFA